MQATPAHKKMIAQINRIVAQLASCLRLYEKLLYCQISSHMETKLTDNLWFQERTQCSTLSYSDDGEMESNS